MVDDSARAALAGTRFTDVQWFGEVGSTNELATQLARSGAPEGVVVVADHQRAGRGRRGRTWEAPAGSSLLLSVVLRPSWPPEQAHVATLAMAVAAAAACHEVAGVTVEIKWPNDLVASDGRKVGGVLGERLGGAVVVGLGLNVVWPSPPPDGGVTLAELAGAGGLDRATLLVALLLHLDTLVGESPGHVVAAAAARSATLGRDVRVDLGGTVVEGRAVRLDGDGHLVVEMATGPSPAVIAAGDVVHLRDLDR